MTLSVTPSAIAQRPYTDVCFAVAYVVTLLLAVGVGLYAASKSNVNDMLTMPTQCGTGVPGSSRLLQTTSRGSTGASSSAPSFNPFDPRIVNHLGATTAWGISLALAASFLWMTLLQRAARFVVYAVLIAKTIFIFAAAVFCTMLGSFLTAGFFAFCGLILIWVLTRWPQRLRLTSTLLEQSVSVSRAHPGIFPAALGLLFCALLLMAGCVGAGLALYTTGSWQKTLVEPEDPELGGGAFYACRYQVSSSLVYGGWGVLAVCAYWSFELFFAIRFHVVALTTGVWYYKNLAGGGGYPGGGDSEAPGASLTKQTLSQPICTALRLAFTRSFGSLCLASLILTICEWLKRMARRSARDNGLLGLLIAGCIMCILNYIEFLTRFAICFQALTGGSFCSSAKTFKRHLERHGLKVSACSAAAAAAAAAAPAATRHLPICPSAHLTPELAHRPDASLRGVTLCTGMVRRLGRERCALLWRLDSLPHRRCCHGRHRVQVEHRKHGGQYRAQPLRPVGRHRYRRGRHLPAHPVLCGWHPHQHPRRVVHLHGTRPGQRATGPRAAGVHEGAARKDGTQLPVWRRPKCGPDVTGTCLSGRAAGWPAEGCADRQRYPRSSDERRQGLSWV